MYSEDDKNRSGLRYCQPKGRGPRERRQRQPSRPLAPAGCHMIWALVGGVRCVVSAPALGRPRGAPLTTDQWAASQSVINRRFHVHEAEPSASVDSFFAVLRN